MSETRAAEEGATEAEGLESGSGEGQVLKAPVKSGKGKPPTKKRAAKKAAAKKAAKKNTKKQPREKPPAEKKPVKKVKPGGVSPGEEKAGQAGDPFEVARRKVRGSITKIVNKLVDEAVAGSCTHAKTLLEMTGARHMFDEEKEADGAGEPWAKLVLERLEEAEQVSEPA
jgi:hypothetical protein